MCTCLERAKSLCVELCFLFSWVNTCQWMLESNDRCILTFLKNLPNYSPKCLYYFSPPAAVCENCGSSTSLQIPGVFNSKLCAQWYLIMVFVCVSLMTNYLKLLFTYLFSTHTSSLLKYPKLLFFLIFIIESWNCFIYILYTNPLYTLQIHLLQIFSVSMGLVFTFSLTVSFEDDTVRFLKN